MNPQQFVKSGNDPPRNFLRQRIVCKNLDFDKACKMKIRIITKNKQSIQLFKYKLTSAVELTVTEPCVA